MRIKIVAPASSLVIRRLRNYPDAIPKGTVSYKETLLFHPQGTYGAPELVAVRVFNEHDENAVVVHLGHDLRNQEEHVIESGEKDREIYKYMELGFQPVGEFNIHEEKYRIKEFWVKLTVVENVGAFLTIEREFPGESTDIFAEKQKRAVHILRELGVDPKTFLDVDIRGMLIMLALQQAQKEGNKS